MKKKLIVTITILVTALQADGHSNYGKRGVAPVENKLYKTECSSCHFTYQAGLLPKKSWEKLMSNLENHFGTDASLEKEDKDTLLAYLVKNSADNSTQYKRSRKISNSIPSNQIPIAISDTPYFKKEHREIAKQFIEQKEVKSISNCIACHTTANRGIYSERDINIPNYGKWEDD
jgi:predicted nucleic acid binding AN1-type Zn finger protein